MDPTHQPTRRVILGTSWHDGTPWLRVRDDDATASVLIPAIGVRLHYRASADSTRHCLGHTPFRATDAAYVDCANRPSRGNRTCERCAIVEATLASNLHHAHTRGRAELDPAVVEHLCQPNELYLAAFRDGSVKIGTTAAARRHKRLTEQGAWRAIIVADARDGFAVRDVEDRVTTELQVPQSVAIGRKLDGMVSPRPDEALGATLARLRDAVHTLVSRMSDERLAAADTVWAFPGADDAVWVGLHRYPLKLETGAHDVEIREVCGRMAVLGRPGSADVFVADLGRLYGVELDIGDHQPDELAVQDSLF